MKKLILTITALIISLNLCACVRAGADDGIPDNEAKISENAFYTMPDSIKISNGKTEKTLKKDTKEFNKIMNCIEIESKDAGYSTCWCCFNEKYYKDYYIELLYNDDATQKINITGSTGNLVSKEINYNSLFIHKKDDDGHGFSFYYKSEGERYWGTHSGNFKLNEKTKPIIDSFLK